MFVLSELVTERVSLLMNMAPRHLDMYCPQYLQTFLPDFRIAHCIELMS